MMRNLAYILQTRGHDVGGLCVWLFKLLADHPGWLEVVRSDTANVSPDHVDAAERVVSVFASPDGFDPDRFLAGRPPRSKYSPFGMAPKSCLGRHVTLNLAALFVRELAHRYDIRTRADGAITFGPFPWRPSRAFRVELIPAPAREAETRGAENRTPVPLARA